ncbi:MAG TPA: hypothetical protein GX405_09145 [Rhizobiales bacterium]|nr:hypothetical protein [Hyphomicrobiales bacterium]
MRWAARIVFLLMLAAGVLLGIGLPKAVERLPGYEIARPTLYSADRGFSPAEVMLAPGEAPLFLTLAVFVGAPLRAGEERSTFALTLRDERGATVLDEVFALPNDPVRDESGRGYVYREMLVVDRHLDGRHAVELTIAPRPDPSIAAVELTVSASAIDLDPRLQPAGFILLVVGGIGLMLGFRGRREPPAPRWGRGRD